jgi:hypothetical protein
MKRAIVFAVAVFGFVGAARADGEPVRIRGEIVSLAGNALVVHPKQGADVTLKLLDGWSAIAVTKAAMSDIKPGVFIGTASAPQADGSLRSLEVVVFPDSMRGFGEGHYPWDLGAKSMMTNATVGKAVAAVDGQTVDLTYKGGEQKITIPADVPVVALSPAATNDVKPGEMAFIPATKQSDGSIDAKFVLFGKDGVVPPM